MKFTNLVTVTGMKRAKGDFEGTIYDNTKFFLEMELDTSKGDALGKGAEAYAMDKSDEYDKFKSMPFPFQAMGEFEMVSTGKTTKITLLALKPNVQSQQPGKTGA